MAIDQYAICPCGSGKKIKFCKCFDSIGELEKVMKMVQGGQMVAALDRLNQIFKQHPTAAWTLAIKGRLLLGMNELPNLMENAERFIRLQPSNPLALAQKAAAQAAQGKLMEAAHSILQALAESGQSVDSLIIEICGILALSLARSGNFLSARMFATIALMASQEDSLRRVPQIVLEELNGSEQINLLLKTLPTTVPRPASVPWGERYDEAQGLLYSNQILASESKLEALDRQYPNEPAIMMSLFVCAIWRADKEAQARLLAKVSDSLTADPEKAIRLLAISWQLGSESQSLDLPFEIITYKLDDAEQAILELTAEPRLELLPETELQYVKNDDNIHPRAGFAILDRPPHDLEEITSDAIKDLSLIQGIAFVFGRQTDKPPQLMIRQVYSYDVGSVKDLITQVLASATPEEQPEAEGDRSSLPLTHTLQPRFFLNRGKQQVTLSDDLLNELHWAHLSQHVVKFKLPCLGGKSVSDLANDQAAMRERAAFMRILQGDMSMISMQDLIDKLSDRMGVPPLARSTPKNDEELELLPAFDLLLVDVESLDNDSLFYYFERTSQAGISELAMKAAKKIIALQSDDEETLEMIMRAYVGLVSGVSDHKEAIEYAQQGRVWCAARNIPDASILLSAVPRHLYAMDPQGFSTAIQEIQSKYGTNPEVMTHLTRMLIDLGILNPDGTPRRSPAPPTKANSPLWSGEASAAAATPTVDPQAESAPSGGGSKLWLPGMD